MPVRDQKKFWDLYAPVYNLFMGINKKNYQQIYQKIRKTILKKQVLEIATGTGLVAKNTAQTAKKYIATDFSEQMLYQAQKGKKIENLYFMKADACALPFQDHSFDVVIASNVLHIMPDPEKALSEIRRVLKSGGILIAPTFVQENQKTSAVSLAVGRMLTMFGISYSDWTEEQYLNFLKKNKFRIRKKELLPDRMSMLYTELTCR
ncbi:MAG: class I SAM-dependent methyltransferase [Oscillospiraceae bacterium]|nr:class I SAM-dependent methyltransferase [Oscillospiraceae bacterium]MDE5883562.1 class I SAM-dependent methyltransferase [Oscillospiraceae bacterium]